MLWHCAVQAPWQNGVCERAGGILKCLLGAIAKKHSIANFDEMEIALGEAVAAYNHDVNELGVSPAQAALGKQPRLGGDALGGFQSRLAEHGLHEKVPQMTRRLALRETARVSMMRLHFSRAIRRGELARSRTSTLTQPVEPGMIVYFWRETKYNPRNSGHRRKLTLKRWHGPALLVAKEIINAYVSFKGQLTKCALEHIRPASALEQISAETWRDAVEEAVEAAPQDEGPVVPACGPAEVPVPEDDVPDPPIMPLTGGELVAALQPRSTVLSSQPPAEESRRTSLLSIPEEDDKELTAAPGTPIPDLIKQASQIGTSSVSSRFDGL